VLAFIDDDAVPEPTWLTHHDSSLLESGATASVGFVRGPDGIRFQSRFHSIDREARTHDERADGESPFVPDLPEGRAVKLIGTNMAIRTMCCARWEGLIRTITISSKTVIFRFGSPTRAIDPWSRHWLRCTTHWSPRAFGPRAVRPEHCSTWGAVLPYS
jgi:hypothetical protein